MRPSTRVDVAQSLLPQWLLSRQTELTLSAAWMRRQSIDGPPTAREELAHELAALVGPPRYRTTQAANPVRARQTWRRAARAYLSTRRAVA